MEFLVDCLKTASAFCFYLSTHVALQLILLKCGYYFVLFCLCSGSLSSLGNPCPWVNVICQTSPFSYCSLTQMLSWAKLLVILLNPYVIRKNRHWRGRSLKIVFSFLLLKVSNMNSSRERVVYNKLPCVLYPQFCNCQLFAVLFYLSSNPQIFFFFLAWGYFILNFLFF